MVSFSSLTSASSLAVTEAMHANALLEALHTSCDQARRAGDSLAVTEAMYANAKPYILRATKRGARVTVVR